MHIPYLEMHQVKGGRMDYIFWFLIALIGITPKVLRELESSVHRPEIQTAALVSR